MDIRYGIIAALFGAFGVVIGAFGAHGLKNILNHHQTLETFQTGVQYQFYHTFALFTIALCIKLYPHPMLNWAAISMIAGIILFSGSLYILSLTGIKVWGAVTPFGGLLLIIGWALLGLSLFKQHQ
ncbi:MAG: DUF423 domain-containing protein [Fibrobacterales bacterium]